MLCDVESLILKLLLVVSLYLPLKLMYTCMWSFLVLVNCQIPFCLYNECTCCLVYVAISMLLTLTI